MNENIIQDQTIITQESKEAPVVTETTEVKTDVVDSPSVFTEEEVSKKVQSETDKVRTEYTKKLKKLEERIAELEPKDLTPAEIEMKRRLDELESKQREVEAKEVILNLQSKLAEYELPKSLVTYLDGNCDIEQFAKIIDTIVIERNKGLGYQPTPHVNADGMTKEKWNKMSYSQRVEIYNTNPDFYAKFMN